jgi:hypothetical protein
VPAFGFGSAVAAIFPQVRPPSSDQLVVTTFCWLRHITCNFPSG